jgi:hypothetical protein
LELSHSLTGAGPHNPVNRPAILSLILQSHLDLSDILPGGYR